MEVRTHEIVKESVKLCRFPADVTSGGRFSSRTKRSKTAMKVNVGLYYAESDLLIVGNLPFCQAGSTKSN